MTHITSNGKPLCQCAGVSSPCTFSNRRAAFAVALKLEKQGYHNVKLMEGRCPEFTTCNRKVTL